MPSTVAATSAKLFIISAVTAVWLCDVVSAQGCTPPTPIDGGYYYPIKPIYSYGDQINYTCDSGYHMPSGTGTRRCQGFVAINAYIWSGAEPECALKACPEPDILDAEYVIPDSLTYTSTFYYKCREGLSPMGNQLATCAKNSTWTYIKCTEPEFFCTRPPTVPNAKHNTSLIRQQHGTVVEYKCDGGYRLEGEAILTCETTTWRGSPPRCIALPGKDLPTEREEEEAMSDPITSKVLPIVAGVMTALILTTILIVTVLCLRHRQRKSSHRAESVDSESTISPPRASTPRQSQLTTMGSMRLPPHTNNTAQRDHVLTLPYHRIQCQHIIPGTGCVEYSKADYAKVDSPCHFRPVILSHQSDHIHSSSPSTVQSDVPSMSDNEFHTIRECLGDTKNNNMVPNSTSTPAPAVSPPALPVGQIPPHSQSESAVSPPPNYHQIQHRSQPGQPTVASLPHPHQHLRTRTLWTPDGRPYEAVTCPHGVEHVYQPLEHIYEEPRMWTRTLQHPNAV